MVWYVTLVVKVKFSGGSKKCWAAAVRDEMYAVKVCLETGRKSDAGIGFKEFDGKGSDGGNKSLPSFCNLLLGQLVKPEV